MRNIAEIIIVRVIAPCILILLFGTGAFSITSEISPDHIPVNSLYHGSRIMITGETEADREIIIKISSPADKAQLRKKGKAMGLLWMNVGELELNPVSDVYLVFASGEINTLLNKQEQDGYAIGYDAFKRLVEISPADNESEKEMWIKEFIRFKESNRVYGVFPDMIKTEISDGRKTYNLALDWPYEAPPREYKVSIYSVKNSVVQDKTEKSLVVEKVGALKFLSLMAFNNAAVYGIISIIIAIVAGFIVSVIFKSKSGGGGH